MASKTKMDKKPDRRVLRTRKAIMNAFDKLISNGDLDKITVSAIAREADVDRKTFYLHYKSVNDLADKKTEETLGRILDALLAEGAEKSDRERVHIALAEVNSILAANVAVYSHIAARLSTDQMLEYIARAADPAFTRAGLKPRSTYSQQMRMKFQFYAAGVVSLYSSWLRSDRKQPIETVSNAIEEAFSAMHP